MILCCHIPGSPSVYTPNDCLYTLYPLEKAGGETPGCKLQPKTELLVIAIRQNYVVAFDNLNEYDHPKRPLQFNHQITFDSYMVGKQFVFY